MWRKMDAGTKDGRRNSAIRFAVSIAAQGFGATPCPVRENTNAATGNWFPLRRTFLSERK
jgi:hypothetical protein